MKGRRDEGKEEVCWDLLEIGDASWHMPKQLPLLNIIFHDLYVKQAADIERQVLTMGGLRMVQFAV